MSSTDRPRGHVILDRPWQIELAQLHALKHYCRLRAKNNPFVGHHVSLKSLRARFPWFTATNFADAAEQFEDYVGVRESFYGLDGICPFCQGSGYNDEDGLIAEEYLDDCPDCLGTGRSRFARGLDPVTGEPM